MVLPQPLPPRRSLRSPRHPIRADVPLLGRRKTPHRRHRHGSPPARCPRLASRDQPGAVHTATQASGSARSLGSCRRRPRDQPALKHRRSATTPHSRRRRGWQWLDKRVVSRFRAGFLRVWLTVHRRRGRLSRCWPRSPYRALLRRGRLRRNPVLLDACFQSVVAHPAVQGMADGGCCRRWVCGGCGPMGRTVMPGTAVSTVTACGGGVADLDVLDEHGAVVRGCVAVVGYRRVAGQRTPGLRALSIEWHERGRRPKTATPNPAPGC